MNYVSQFMSNNLWVIICTAAFSSKAAAWDRIFMGVPGAYTVVYRSGVRIIQISRSPRFYLPPSCLNRAPIELFQFTNQWPQWSHNWNGHSIFCTLWFHNCLDNKGSICLQNRNYTSTYALFMVFAYGCNHFERDNTGIIHPLALSIKRLQEVL